MKTFLLMALLLMPGLVYSAEKHPAEVAEAKLESAQKSLQVALKRADKAIALIEDKAKQQAASKALADAQKKWQAFVDAEVATYQAATHAPDTSTSAMLGAYAVEADAMNARAKALQHFAEWLEANNK